MDILASLDFSELKSSYALEEELFEEVEDQELEYDAAVDRDTVSGGSC